jgi:hypothetical protein
VVRLRIVAGERYALKSLRSAAGALRADQIFR